jgi:fructuronate reductase
VTAPLQRDRPAPPVRIVHMGLGAFSRSHLAWYTARAADADQWGIAAYTGRSRKLADALTAQDGVYTLVVRGAEGDTTEMVDSIVRAHPGDEVARFFADVAAAPTAIVSLTITEPGYRFGEDGGPDLTDPDVVADDELLRAVLDDQETDATARTAVGRLLLGLDARRRAGAGPLAVMSCDNVPDNGGALRRGILSWARRLNGDLAEWIDAHVAFPSSSVDRITPRLSDEEEAALVERLADTAPVVAEPFSDWVVEDHFPAGRPAWDTAGARFADDLEPWEARKLWMLNGAHTILACLGLARGHRTVSEAMDDDGCRDVVEAFWDEAARHLPEALDADGYRASLRARFGNPRIEHLLSQIAAHSRLKLGLRVAPVARRERAAGRDAAGCAGAIAAWLLAAREGVLPGAGGEPSDALAGVAAVSPELGGDAEFVAAVSKALDQLAVAASPA